MTARPTRIVTLGAILMAVAHGMAVLAQTPKIDALRARAEQGDAVAQFSLGAVCGTGRSVPQDYVQAHM